MSQQLLRHSGVLWDEYGFKAYCPKHKLEMDAYTYNDTDPIKYDHLKCEECEVDYKIPRDIEHEKKYLRRKLESKSLKDAEVLNLDDEAIPIAEAKAVPKDGKYFVTAVLTESKTGKRLIVYAGERGKKAKTQIFVEPAIKRLSFDHNDIHPSEIFVKLEATFEDGVISSIDKSRQEKV